MRLEAVDNSQDFRSIVVDGYKYYLGITGTPSFDLASLVCSKWCP